MDDAQFTRWVELVKQRTGMRLPAERKSFLVTSLGLRMREVGYTDYQAYYDYLVSGRQGMVEWATLVDRLTVHETRFFRHEGALNVIRKHCLPGATQDPPAERIAVQAWSAGCATGEEPYTLAMIIDDHLASLGCEYYVGITATDISAGSLAEARRGIYSRHKLKDLDPRLLGKYFTRIDDGNYQVSEQLRKRVCFARMNILDIGHAPLGDMDIIVCQNLLIYFDREERIKILNAVVEHLAPGGVLILGAAEILGWSHPQLQRLKDNDALAFRRLPEPSAECAS